MRTDIARILGCEVPIFAFSHCRDVVVEVTKAGGFGVLGSSMFGPEALEAELRWIDSHVDGKPYGVDVVVPSRYEHKAEGAAVDYRQLIPQSHRDFMEKIMADEGIPPLPPDERERVFQAIVKSRGAETPEGARRIMQVIYRHPQVKLVVSALGVPPADVVDDLKRRRIVLGAMCGKGRHAVRQIEAGIDLLIAQGTEAAGHTGDISTMVLIPEVLAASAGRVPVLAAGGITTGGQIAAVLAMGAQGVWCGTIWLPTKESELNAFEKSAIINAQSGDAVRRKVRTGKTVRMKKSKLSEIWEQPGAPPYLQSPLQAILFNEYHARIVRAEREDLYSFPVGQAVGMLRRETTVRDEMYRLKNEYLEAVERLIRISEAT